MNDDRYRILFTIVVLLFGTLLLYRYLGEDRFFKYIDNIQSEVYRIASLSVDDDITVPFVPKPIQLNTLGRIGIGSYLSSIVDEKNINEVDKYERLIGHKLQYVLLFRAWNDIDRKFPTDLVKTLSERHIVPIVTWEPWKRDFVHPTAIDSNFSLESIALGLHDEYIREWAKDSKEVDSLYILRFGHEQSTFPGEQSWYPWQGRPEAYKRAYRRIADIFREEGALNVRYMWNPVMFWPETTMQYYPGDTYVDYIGLTVLNHGFDSVPTDRRWKRCGEQYVKQYNVIKSIDRPVIAVEFASTDNGGLKDQWIIECVSLMKNNPRLVGLITLENKSDPTHPGINWSMNSTYKNLSAFKTAISTIEFK